MKRKHSPAHDYWHPRVEGQIRDAMKAHPEWFRYETEWQMRVIVNSLSKRIVGEIVAGRILATLPGEVAANCLSSVEAGRCRVCAAGAGERVVASPPLSE